MWKCCVVHPQCIGRHAVYGKVWFYSVCVCVRACVCVHLYSSARKHLKPKMSRLLSNSFVKVERMKDAFLLFFRHLHNNRIVEIGENCFTGLENLETL